MERRTPLAVGLPVRDLDRMQSFYCTVLSCRELRRADIPQELSQAIRVSQGSYVNVWLQTPYGEIIKMLKPSVPPRRSVTLNNSGEETGFAYLTFYCNDVEGALAEAEAQGARLKSDKYLLSGEMGLKLAFFEDPEGNVIELVERTQD